VISYRLLAALLLVVQSLTGSGQDGQAGTPEANPTSSASIPAARTYTNETIGFSYPLLNGYVLNEDATKQYQLRPGTGTLFVADQVVNGRPCVNRIMAMADDTSHYPSPMRPETFATTLALSFTSNPAVKVTRGPYSTRMGDKAAFRTDYTKKLSCGVMYQSLLILKVRSFEVCFMVGAFSQKEREQLLASLQAISYRK
jgi:hypothetical protein